MAATVVIPAITVGLSLVIYPLLVVPLKAEFGVGRSVAMSVMAATTLCFSLMMPAVGWSTARSSPRAVMACGSLVMALGLFIASQAHAFWLVGLAFIGPIAVGAAHAGGLPAKTLAIRHFPQRAGALSGLIGLGGSLLAAIVPWVAAIFLSELGWRSMLVWAAALVGFIIAPLSWLLLVEPRGPAPKVPAIDGALQRSSSLSTSAIFGAARFWLIVVTVLPFMIALAAVSSNIAMIAGDAGLAMRETGLLMSIIAGGGAFGTVISGWLADRLEPRGLYTAIALVAAFALAAMASWDGFLVLATGGAMLGFATGSVMPMMSVLVIRHFGLESFPRVTGLVAPCLMPATLSSAGAAGIRDVTGSYDLAFVLACTLLMPGVAAIWRLHTVSPPRWAPSLPDRAKSA